MFFLFFPKKKKKYFSREKPLRRRYLKRWGEEEAAGAAAESVGATGGRAATSGTAARVEPDSRDRVRGPRLQSQSLRFFSGCSRGSCAGDAGGHWAVCALAEQLGMGTWGAGLTAPWPGAPGARLQVGCSGGRGRTPSRPWAREERIRESSDVQSAPGAQLCHGTTSPAPAR